LYDFRLGEVAAWIKSFDAKIVAIQMPEGLKIHAQRIARQLEADTGVTILIVGDPCYGACDYTARYGSYADALVQFGHSEIPSIAHDPKVLFVEVFVNLDINELLQKALPRLMDRIGLITTVQHVHMLPQIRAWLESNCRQVFVGKGDNRVKFEGQVLGCNITSIDPIVPMVDQFLYIGSGDFHPLSAAIAGNRPVLIVDPLMGEVREIEELKDRILRQRHAAIERAVEARKILVLVSTKIGQKRMEEAVRLRRLAEANDRTADIVLMEEFSPDQLLSYDADAFVSTACPRIAIDDYLRYPKPILTPIEMEIASPIFMVG
jgi:2-(3-amino-3-carboxypropyl)histidine synthase